MFVTVALSPSWCTYDCSFKEFLVKYPSGKLNKESFLETYKLLYPENSSALSSEWVHSRSLTMTDLFVLHLFQYIIQHDRYESRRLDRFQWISLPRRCGKSNRQLRWATGHHIRSVSSRISSNIFRMIHLSSDGMFPTMDWSIKMNWLIWSLRWYVVVVVVVVDLITRRSLPFDD